MRTAAGPKWGQGPTAQELNCEIKYSCEANGGKIST